jgi:hypothetical protein
MNIKDPNIKNVKKEKLYWCDEGYYLYLDKSVWQSFVELRQSLSSFGESSVTLRQSLSSLNESFDTLQYYNTFDIRQVQSVSNNT